MDKNLIVEELKKQIYAADLKEERKKVGKVIEVGDGIAKAIGLDDVMMAEMVKFESTDNNQEEVLGWFSILKKEMLALLLLVKLTKLKREI